KGADVWVVAAFPVAASDELVLVTNRGQLIRCPVRDIRIAGRSTRGVRVFHVDQEERVVSVARLDEVETAEGAEDADDEEDAEDTADMENAEDAGDIGDAGAARAADTEGEEDA
ncbi:MAG: DNA gyrase C-terminal beta-propeller domain-containing protein, partial [Kiloniellales bacterium]|nr:DNA gyrase C-terminal beta-propeller domain-containing protein [Kiloniellales bacterium]